MHATRTLRVVVAENPSQCRNHVSLSWATHTLRVDHLAAWSPCTRHHAPGRPRKGFVEGFKRGWGYSFAAGFSFIHLGFGERVEKVNSKLLPCKLDQPETWHSTVDQALRTSEFYQVSRVGVIRGNFAMLSALVERWQPEINTFVMLVCEVTVTLEEVLHIYGLPIDREVVIGWTDSSHDFLVTQSLAIFGSEFAMSSSSKGYTKLSWVCHIRDTQPLDTWESIQCYVRCQIFCLLGTTLFIDKSTAYAHAKYLPLLQNFDQIGNYSWGSACLAHLYRSLCRASRHDCKMGGSLDLLFVWAWECMLWLAPIPRQQLAPVDIPMAH
ncbi:hypothetical protein Ahy_A01g000157 [Arachis hypogaea]|uniref:Aminotransferase-like plant mobile domain-containing protein n=1 Tax=Arachis hypogaea TaxID=3818 RepID=A0A445EJH1_ARAHY|nr:hypothetical protein Ahy_A01g000157 [Arachis hypogaea]